MNQFARFSNTRRRTSALAIACAITCGLLLALPSCGIPDLRGPDPAQPVPGNFEVRKAESSPDVPEALPDDSHVAANAGTSALMNIEEFFNDPILTGLIRQAIAGNQEQKILIQDVQIAANQILTRQGALMPFLTVGGAAGLQRISEFTVEGAGIRDDPYRAGKLFSNPHGNYQLGTELWWQIDIWRQLRDARESAIQRYVATNEGRNYAVTRLVAQIAESYYELLALDRRLEILDQTIALFQQSYEAAQLKMKFARGNELAVQRFLAEVRKNQSEKLTVNQQIIEAENRINFLVGRFPQPVERTKAEFFALTMPPLGLGVPPELLQYRPDIRQAERELRAAGLDVLVARKNFYPKLIINGGVGYQAFNARYLLVTPEALLYNLAAELTAPLVNKRMIQAEYLTANSRQLQTLYNYQRVVLNAFTEVINRMSKVENYSKSIVVKKEQLTALELSVNIANQLFQQAQPGFDYVDVLLAQRDLRDARMILLETKQQQLQAMVFTYQALGGGNLVPNFTPDVPKRHPFWERFSHLKGDDQH